jgi:anti-repressor protein
MNTLLQLSAHVVGDCEVQTINARVLHVFLEVGKDFSNWVKDRIEQYNFVENQDFVCSPILASEGRGGHNRKDYHLTLDMGKELAMVERNEKGKQARQYFIECERRAKMPVDPMKVLNDPSAMRGLLLTYSEKVLVLEAANAEMLPKVAALDRIANAEGSTCISTAAKMLQMRPKDLFAWLSCHRWIFRRTGSSPWVGYQDKIQQQLLETKAVVILRSDGTEKSVESILVTPKSLAKLAELIPQQRAAA